MSRTTRLGNPSSGNIGDLFLEKRIIFATGQVSLGEADAFVAKLLWLSAEDPVSPIYVLLDNVGGTVVSGLAMIDAIRIVRAPVHMVCFGFAASMGAMLLSSGEKGHRCAFPNTQIMIHQPSSGASGFVSDQKIEMAEAERLKRVTAQILAENTGQSFDTIMRDWDRNYYMTPDEAMAYGLIDRVIEPKSWPPT